jgi:hypothetical protein
MTDKELERYAELIKLMGEDSILLVLRSLASAAVLEGMENIRVIYERKDTKEERKERGCWNLQAELCDCPACGGFND